MFNKKEKQYLSSLYNELGFSFQSQPLENNPHRVTICFLKGLLIFFASFGTIGGILNAFEINYNVFLVCISLLLLSCALSFLHYNKWIFNLCYPLIFILFSVAIFENRVLANSGFQAFLSILYEKYTSHFDLSITREVIEGNQNRYLTITVAAIFVGFVLALLLNVAISSQMNFLLTFCITAPLLQVGIYIGEYPSPLYFLPLMFTYLVVFVLGSYKHYNFSTSMKEANLFIIKKEGRSIFHEYQVNGKILVQIACLFSVISIIFACIFFPFVDNQNEAISVTNRVKKTTDEYVKQFVQGGFSSFFNRYSATGGISSGRLGGVSSIRPDYETDLIVTFVPHQYETIYLKAYTGAEYTGSSWEVLNIPMNNYRSLYKNDFDEFTNFVTYLESNQLRHLYQTTGGTQNAYAKMTVENVDANMLYHYIPYYTDNQNTNELYPSNFIPKSKSTNKGTHTFSYYPVTNNLESLTSLSTNTYADSLPIDSQKYSYLTSYRELCYDNYTYVPENLTESLNRVISTFDHKDGFEDKINSVIQYFYKNYTYSTSPGTTPYNEDYIRYFLTDQNQGYCAHFASAATMLYRQMGIPARYIEGYVITVRAMSDALPMDEDVSSYIEGTIPLKQTGVIQVDVTDQSAHAWVEVYNSSFGWIPIEVTPPSSDEQDYNSLLGLFSSLFSVSPSGNAATTTVFNPEGTTSAMNRFYQSTDHILFPFILCGLSILFALLLYRNWKYISTRLKYIKALIQKNYSDCIIFSYEIFIVYLLRKKKVKKEVFLPSMLVSYFPDNNQILEYAALVEKAGYSMSGCSKEEFYYTRIVLKTLRKAIKKKN